MTELSIPPIVLPDGTKIDAQTGEVIENGVLRRPKKSSKSEEPTSDDTQEAIEEEKPVEVNTNIALVGNYKAQALPDSGKRMTAIAAVASLELWGLSPVEIAKALGASLTDVDGLQASEQYLEYKQGMLRNVMRALGDDVRGQFAKTALDAAGVVLDTMKGKNKSDLRMKAAESILDRGGFGPKQIVDHNHRMEGELIIRTIKSADTNTIPDIEV